LEHKACNSVFDCGMLSRKQLLGLASGCVNSPACGSGSWAIGYLLSLLNTPVFILMGLALLLPADSCSSHRWGL